MASPAVSFSFTNSTTADAGQVNTNFSDLIAAMTDGTKDFSIAALTLAGALTANGHCTFGNATSDDITVTGSIASSIPVKTTATYNFGTSTIAMLSMYFGRNSQTTRLIGSAAMAATYTFTLPANVGAAGDVLVDSDAAATTAWQPVHEASELRNLSISSAVGTSALTIALKDAAGSDPSASSPVRIAFRSSTATTGSYAVRSVTSALSVVVSSGSTLGHADGIEDFIYVYAIDNAGTVELAVSTKLFDEGTRQSTTAEGGSGGADSGSVLYSTTARTNVAIRLIGRLKSTQTTAGTWAAVPTETTSGSLYPLLTKYEIRTGAGPYSTDSVAIFTFDKLVAGLVYRVSIQAELRTEDADTNSARLTVRHNSSSSKSNGTQILVIGRQDLGTTQDAITEIGASMPFVLVGTNVKVWTAFTNNGETASNVTVCLEGPLPTHYAGTYG